MSAHAEVTVYAARTCPYCVRAEKLLKSKGVAYRRERIWLFLPGGRRPLVERFGAEHTTVPQIVIDGEHVGGCDDLVALEQSGRLDELLGRA
ncbi:glutaredoxin domain-containing protein [Patulibacter sp.]|uniref:glutaredoxin domain-containing protein n=1 Tax=Patulibacter sp. TaxID=1912859 RepID=UPI002715C8BA|nr:glutaredoxin domain-containing protein [Patulibacter sp.]MDO9407401.1 glutaredoxin domain-containing protein [Patulibacter sp.]